jgi:Putative bacterial sensory transduction regulator
MNVDLERAEQQLTRLREAAQAMELRCVDIESPGFAAAFAVPTTTPTGTLFATVSFPLTNPNSVYVTGGAMREPEENRGAILEACNQWTADSPTLPAFLHSAGDVLIQHKLPAEVFIRFPPLLEILTSLVPVLIPKLRGRFEAAGVSGAAYDWTVDDVRRLAVHSVT